MCVYTNLCGYMGAKLGYVETIYIEFLMYFFTKLPQKHIKYKKCEIVLNYKLFILISMKYVMFYGIIVYNHLFYII